MVGFGFKAFLTIEHAIVCNTAAAPNSSLALPICCDRGRLRFLFFYLFTSSLRAAAYNHGQYFQNKWDKGYPSIFDLMIMFIITRSNLVYIACFVFYFSFVSDNTILLLNLTPQNMYSRSAINITHKVLVLNACFQYRIL